MKLKFFTLLFAAACVFSLNNFDANAQGRRSLPSPTPPPLGVPVVISRADDYPTGDQTVVVEPETQTEEDLRRKLDEEIARVKELKSRISSLESNKEQPYDANQKRLLLNLDILSRAEQRSETLRKQLFEMIEKENAIKTRIDQISYDSREEIIRMSTATIGSLRPEDVRDARQKALKSEKANLESLLEQIQTNRAALELSVSRADAMVEKIRLKLEKEIDDALNEELEP